MAAASVNVRFRGQSRHDPKMVSCLLMTHFRQPRIERSRSRASKTRRKYRIFNASISETWALLDLAHMPHSARLSGEGQRVDGDFFERGV